MRIFCSKCFLKLLLDSLCIFLLERLGWKSWVVIAYLFFLLMLLRLPGYLRLSSLCIPSCFPAIPLPFPCIHRYSISCLDKEQVPVIVGWLCSVVIASCPTTNHYQSWKVKNTSSSFFFFSPQHIFSPEGKTQPINPSSGVNKRKSKNRCDS